MSDLRKAAQQALDALVSQFDGRADAIYILSAALAEPMQEPVAWMDREGDLYKMPEIEGWAPPHTMLYAAPPQRKPLTADETMSILNATAGQHWCDEAHLQRFRAAIERAHGIE